MSRDERQLGHAVFMPRVSPDIYLLFEKKKKNTPLYLFTLEQQKCQKVDAYSFDGIEIKKKKKKSHFCSSY